MTGTAAANQRKNAGQGGAFAAARGAGDQHQAVFQGGGFLQPFPVWVRGKGGQGGQDAEGCCFPPEGVVHVDTDAGGSYGASAVAGAAAGPFLFLFWAQEIMKERGEKGIFPLFLQFLKTVINPDRHRFSLGYVDIRHGGIGSDHFFHIHRNQSSPAAIIDASSGVITPSAIRVRAASPMEGWPWRFMHSRNRSAEKPW